MDGLLRNLVNELSRHLDADDVLPLSELKKKVIEVTGYMPESNVSTAIEAIQFLFELLAGGETRATARVNDRMKLWYNTYANTKNIFDAFENLSTFLKRKRPIYSISGNLDSSHVYIVTDFIRLDYIRRQTWAAVARMQSFQASLGLPGSVLVSKCFFEILYYVRTGVEEMMQRILDEITAAEILRLASTCSKEAAAARSLSNCCHWTALSTGEIKEFLLTSNVEFATGWERLWKKVDRTSSLDYLISRYRSQNYDCCYDMDIDSQTSYFAILDSCDHILCDWCAREDFFTRPSARRCTICHTPMRNWLSSKIFNNLKSLINS